jgi:hypothetical protein
MSLPGGQQRVLDGIAEVLRTNEPRLASMFAIFTRLSKDEPPPRREQLTATGPRALLIGAWRRPPRWEISADRGTRRMMLLISRLAIAFIVLATLLGLSAHAPARCAAPRTAGAAAATLHLACEAPVGGISAGGK